MSSRLVRLGRQWDEILKRGQPPVKVKPAPAPARLLSILIPSLTERVPLLMRLLWQLQPQLEEYSEEAEVLVLADNRAVPIGTKIDALTTMAEGKFATVVADDDIVKPQYVERLVKTVQRHSGVDVISFEFDWNRKGLGASQLIEDPDAKSVDWVEKAPGVYHTWPSDKAAIRLDLRRGIFHEPLFDNEDERFAARLRPAIKTHYHISEVLYEIWQDPKKEDSPEKRKERGIREANRVKL